MWYVCGRLLRLYGTQTAADYRCRRDYGQGSSRDWAAKGVRLAGVEAIVAEGFERIHRTNLVGMGASAGIHQGRDRLTYAIDGTETFSVKGNPAPTAALTVTMTA